MTQHATHVEAETGRQADSRAQSGSSTSKAAAGRRTSNIEVMILAFNEDKNLRHALASVASWADAVHVVDSGSTDGTRQIAREMGANVVDRPWLGYAAQKNWGLDNIPFSADWVFILDADEAISDELRDELIAIAAKPHGQVREAGYYVNRLTYFMGRPIRHCGYFPSYNLRFFKKGRARYEDREVHEHMVVDGPTGRLRHCMLHEDRRPLEHFIAKHNRYSTLEARELVRGQNRNASGKRAEQLERGIAVRRWLKYTVLPKLPFSGVWRFLYMYVWKLGFLDGVTGFRFCSLLATYDTFISLKLAELRAAGVDPAKLERSPIAASGLAVREGDLALDSAPAPAAPSAAPAQRAAAKPVLNGAAARAPTPITEPAPSLPAPLPRGLTAPTPEDRPRPEPRHALADQLAVEHDRSRMPPGKWPAAGSVPVSVLVPVKNEKLNIVDCLRHVQWADELVVIDSQSTDPTVPLSQAMGAEVYQFFYSREGWPKKKNWALENVPWRNEWVLILDADEFMTPELTEEVRQVVMGEYTPDPGKGGCGDGYWLNRRFMFMGRWIKGCGYYPSYNVRLFKHKVGRYERIGNLGQTGSGDNEVHEHVVLSTGEAGYLRHEFLHYAYPDLSSWIEKHNRYTTWEAHAMEAKDEGAVQASLFGGPIARRRWLKRFARRLPFRPTLRFLFSYFGQGGFRDGYPGLVMCRLLAWYEFVSVAKYREMRDREKRRARGDRP